MTNFTTNPGSVRVDFYKRTKWYMTEEVDMSAHWADIDIYQAVAQSLLDQGQARYQSLMRQFIIIVQEPYHKNAFPVILHPEENL